MRTSIKSILVLLILSCSALAQTVEKRAGEIIYLNVCGAEGNSVRFYRQTTPLSTPVQIDAIIQRTPNKLECKEIKYVMPGGVTSWYRFVAVPYLGTEALPSTNGTRVKRIK